MKIEITKEDYNGRPYRAEIMDFYTMEELQGLAAGR